MRVVRAVRWSWKRIARRPPALLVEVRWRLGDEILAIPVYEGLKRRYPNSHLSVWCSYPDLIRGNPCVDQVIGPDDLPTRAPCDRYILLRGAPRDVYRHEHYARVAGIPLPLNPPRVYDDEGASAYLERFAHDPSGFVAVCTGGTWETKRWPIENWRELCVGLARDGRRLVQLGSGDEEIPGVDSLVNATTVREAASLLRAARLLVTCDSGLMHLALAVGAPVLALFGPTDPTILIRDRGALTVMTNGRPCQGCWNRLTMKKEGVCPLDISSCMGSLPTEAVLRRAREILGRESRRA